MMDCERRNLITTLIKNLRSMEYIFVMILMLELSTGHADLHDVILSPHPSNMLSAKYALFQPRSFTSKAHESSTKVPWEEPLKETANFALSNAKISKSSIMKASYNGFLDLDNPTFGDIAVLAKGKLKKNADKTFSFEQINDRCDDKCQINADKYLENVTALWMVERIRHRDPSGNSHRFDLKFTIVPIFNEQRHQIDHNVLENRLKNHLKKTFILRDFDYPNYFKPNANRRSDLFPTGFQQGLSSLMNISPNSLMQNLFGFNAQQTSSPRKFNQKNQIKDNRLNTGEFYMAPKISNNAKTSFHPTINGHANQLKQDYRVRFPDSKEMTLSKPPLMNLYRPKPEIYNQNAIDYRGSNDNVFVGSSDHQNIQTHQNVQTHQHIHHNHPPIYNQQTYPQTHQNPSPFNQHQQSYAHSHRNPQPLQQAQQNYQQNQQGLQSIQSVPVYSIPVDMPIIQFSQTPYAIPFQIQLSTPSNQQLYQQQPDVTTFRYQPQLIGLSNQPPPSLFNQYLPLNLVQTNSSKPFHESERHTMNYYSPPDPVYHPQQSTTEAPIQPSTYSPRFNNYANIIRHQIETPVLSTASSIQVNKFHDDEDFKPMTPPYDVKKHNYFKGEKVKTFKGSTKKPNSINDQLYDMSENITMPFVTPHATRATSEKEISDYQIVVGRPKPHSFKSSESSSEKPVLKWIPKKHRNKLAGMSSSTTTQANDNSFIPTLIPFETTTQSSSSRLTTAHIFRGRNRFNKRNSSSTNVRAATISPQITTKVLRKKTSTAAPSFVSSTQAPFAETSMFPTYITPVHSSDEPITSQSLSTSISLEVNGERVYDQMTTTPGYELVSAGVESIVTNSTNVKLFKASVVPETFDDLTFSILNHAKTIKNDKDEN